MTSQKRRTLISVITICWIISIIIALITISKFIRNKDTRLHVEIRKNILRLFEGSSNGDLYVGQDDGFFDVVYHDSKVQNFKKIPIPDKPKRMKSDKTGEFYKREMEEWKSNYGSLASLWKLNWGDDDIYHRRDEGWNIVRLNCKGGLDEEFIVSSILFPYMVGLKHSEYGNYYTVPDAVSEAYEFYTTDPKSSYSDRFAVGSVDRLWSEIHGCENEYYHVTLNKNPPSWIAGTPIIKDSSKSYDELQRFSPFENGSMYNGYYVVFVASTQEKKWKIEKYPWNPDIVEMNKLMLWWLSGISVLFLAMLTPLFICSYKTKKIANESLKKRLIRLCSPKNFIGYKDKDFVMKANEIYQKIIGTDDLDTLKELEKEAINGLKINIVDSSERQALMDTINPKKYLEPYNAEKFEQANELFSELQNEKLSYSRLIEIKEHVSKLDKG